MRYTICDPIPGDEKVINDIAKVGWLVTYTNKEYGITKADILSKDFYSKKRLARWRKIIQNNNKNSYISIAKVGKKIVGFCTAQKKDDHNEIGAIYVLPRYHHQGIGKDLLERALEWLGREKDVTLRVVSYNENAIRFYEKSGFVKTKKPIFYAELPSGKKLPEAEMMIKKIYQQGKKRITAKIIGLLRETRMY